ncbi:MAG: hypothetical protein R3C61_17765 [Bacteroidia bacterium]
MNSEIRIRIKRDGKITVKTGFANLTGHRNAGVQRISVHKGNMVAFAEKEPDITNIDSI